MIRKELGLNLLILLRLNLLLLKSFYLFICLHSCHIHQNTSLMGQRALISVNKYLINEYIIEQRSKCLKTIALLYVAELNTERLLPGLGSLNEFVFILSNSICKKAKAGCSRFGSSSNVCVCSNWEFGDVHWVSKLWIISWHTGSLWFWRRNLESSVTYYNIFAHFVNSGKKSSKSQPQVLWHTRLLKMSN